MKDKSFLIDLEPIGRRVRVAPGSTLLAAAQAAGVALVAPCGGAGICGKCRVRVISGACTPPAESEKAHLDAAELAAGWRLACQAIPQEDVKLDIPPDSLSTAQRLQVEGQESTIAPDPAVIPVEVQVPPPTLDDLRADTSRLRDALAERGIARATFEQPVLRVLSERLRAQEWSARLAVRKNGSPHAVIGVLPKEAPLLGLAVDLGSTKIAAYLVALASGRTLAKTGQMNPLVAYGEDIVSRIAYANAHPGGRSLLQERLVTGLNAIAEALCHECAAVPEQIVEAVVVGNTAMHHLFAGLPVRQLGEAPYVPAASEALEICACHLGLKLAPGAQVLLPPNIAGYVGADHVAMLLATEAWKAEAPTLALDIGTNTEISLAVGGSVLSCSCASGPAFEGAHIHAGMRAAPGAIEAVHITGESVHIQTIGDTPPVGICGSGILDAVAELRAAGIVKQSGRLAQDHPRVRPWKGGGAFVLVPASETGNGEDLLVTRRDVHEIQLAKGAIRAGIESLLEKAGLPAEAIETVIVAGAFGTYLNIASAIRVGLFPPLPLARFRQVGNAAGTGARQLLISTARREEANQLVKRVAYIELTTHPRFTDLYMQALML